MLGPEASNGVVGDAVLCGISACLMVLQVLMVRQVRDARHRPVHRCFCRVLQHDATTWCLNYTAGLVAKYVRASAPVPSAMHSFISDDCRPVQWPSVRSIPGLCEWRWAEPPPGCVAVGVHRKAMEIDVECRTYPYQAGFLLVDVTGGLFLFILRVWDRGPCAGWADWLQVIMMMCLV